MTRPITLLLATVLFLIFSSLKAQIKGRVTDSINQPMHGVSVYIKDSFEGTVTNQDGAFFLGDVNNEKGNIVFKSLGFKTQMVPYDLKSPTYFEVSLEEEQISLDEVTLSATENPAHEIIRAAQQKRKEHLIAQSTFSANFYSKGVVGTRKLPKKILGQEIDISNQALDSTRSGILYLSETYSKIFKDREKFKEIITATKVSGDQQGITFNSAKDAEFNFYKNSVNLENELISPIGDAAFSFYRYRLIGTFYTRGGDLINQIEVKRKIDTSPTFEGTIYIVEGDWSFYGLDLKMNRLQSSISTLDEFKIKQNYNYDLESKSWVKSDQVIEFKAGIFGFNFNAHFSGVYTAYDFHPVFQNKTFGKMIYQIENEAHQKDSLFAKNRPIPLTAKELSNYKQKDSISIAHQAPAYLDSIDREKNRFKWKDFLGKKIQNSHNETSYGFSFPLTNINFNTVQGYNAKFKLYYHQDWSKQKKSIKIESSTVYGFSDQKWYPNISMNYLMNKVNYSRLLVSAGRNLIQFDSEQPINLIFNDIYSLFLKENYSKWFENTGMSIDFKRYLKPDLYFSATLEFLRRTPRSNTSEFSYFNKDKAYTPNTPTNIHYDFQDHTLKKYSILLQYRPQNQFYQYPNQRFYSQKENLPKLSLRFTHAFGSTVSRYNFMKLDFTYDQTLSLGMIGETFLKIKSGRFLQKESPAFMDLNHFHGNEILFGKKTPYLNQFNLLPYYQFSSSNNYFLTHWEHHFKKWGVSNWPIIRWLNSQFISGFHTLTVQNQKPYFEWNVGLDQLGFGKFKILRIDYFWGLGKPKHQQGVRMNLSL